MTKFQMFKAVSCFVVSAGVGTIVGNAVKATTPEATGLIKKISIGVGTFALSQMVSEQATKYTENKIDDTVKQIVDMVQVNESTEETI